jgi:peptidase E
VNLFLTSDRLDGARDFLGEVENARILVIMDASTRRGDAIFVERDLKQLAFMGYTKITTLRVAESDEETIREQFAEHNVVFGEGGSQVALMSALRNSGAAELLDQFVRQGGHYLGKSAGSIIAGTEVRYPRGLSKIWDEDEDLVPDGKDVEGFGWIPYRIVPHLPELARTKAIEDFRTRGLQPLGLNDYEAFQVKGNLSAIVRPRKISTSTLDL